MKETQESNSVKTQYRIVSDGFTDFIQYLKETRFLFFKIRRWKCVWNPYFEILSGRNFDGSGYNTLVCRYNTYLEGFVKEWPNIEDYFVYAKKEQLRLEKKVSDYWKEYREKQKTVKYL